MPSRTGWLQGHHPASTIIWPEPLPAPGRPCDTPDPRAVWRPWLALQHGPR